MWRFSTPYIISMKCPVTNGFSIRVICIKRKTRFTKALTLCHFQPPFFQADSLLCCLPYIAWEFTAGAESNCAYNAKDCCQYPYIIPTYGIAMLNIHAPMKYTWPWYAYKAHSCSHTSHISCYKTAITSVSVFFFFSWKIIHGIYMKN